MKAQKIKFKRVLVKDYRDLTGINITDDHTGKMYGIDSLSTSCLKNPRCAARMLKGVKNCICNKCYAKAYTEMRTNLNKTLSKNTDVLTASVLDVVPVLSCKYFRFESFGDLVNDIQFINYLNIAINNPDTSFALWSKNPDIIDNVFKQGYKKPKNLRIVLSSPIINKLTDYTKIYSWCDSVFTVYTYDYATQNNITINCGLRDCLTCTGGRCYFKGGRHPKYVNEILKSDAKKIKGAKHDN